jgi:hypothetical protein
MSITEAVSPSAAKKRPEILLPHKIAARVGKLEPINRAACRSARIHARIFKIFIKRSQPNVVRLFEG